MPLFEQIEKHKSTLSQPRQAALESFLSQKFPSKKDEEFKYTDLSEVTSKQYSLHASEQHQIDAKTLEPFLMDAKHNRIVFVNGVYDASLSQMDATGIHFMQISEIVTDEKYKQIASTYLGEIASNNALVSLNDALFQSGVFLHVSKNSIIEKPIEIFYISQNQVENTFYNPRNLLLAEQGSKVEVIEQHINLDDHFVLTNTLTEIFVDSNAKADWHKLQNDTEKTYLLDQTFAKQNRDSLATVNTFSFGGKLLRNNLDFIHAGENINSFMNGITLIGKDQLVDHHTAVHHNTPNCESYQNYKGIFKDNAHGVFNGKVFVDKIAQKTNAYQQNNNVLLSEGAKIDTKPQLEIFADDVKCSHGCTVGQLDADAMFYLQSRGISKEHAQALLLFAFANDAMENIEIESLKNKVSSLLVHKLGVDFIL